MPCRENWREQAMPRHTINASLSRTRPPAQDPHPSPACPLLSTPFSQKHPLSPSHIRGKEKQTAPLYLVIPPPPRSHYYSEAAAATSQSTSRNHRGVLYSPPEESHSLRKYPSPSFLPFSPLRRRGVSPSRGRNGGVSSSGRCLGSREKRGLLRSQC